MCLAIFKPENEKFPSKKILQSAWQNNPHGAGMAVSMGDSVKIIKGIMTLTKLFELIDSGLFDSLPVVLHFRWATSGGISPELTHPFPISTKNSELKQLEFSCDSALTHNGVLFSPNIGDYSDTAILTKYIALLKPTLLDIELQFCRGNRIAISFSDRVELLGDWTNLDGIYYSNTYSIDIPYQKIGNYFLDDTYESFYLKNSWENLDYEDFEYLEFCPHCDSQNTESIGINSVAYECLDCGAIYNDEFFLESTKTKKAKKRGA